MYSRKLVKTKKVNHQRCLQNFSTKTSTKHSDSKHPHWKTWFYKAIPSRGCCCFKFLHTNTLTLRLEILTCTPVSLWSKTWLCWKMTSVHKKWRKDFPVQLILPKKTRLQGTACKQGAECHGHTSICVMDRRTTLNVFTCINTTAKLVQDWLYCEGVEKYPFYTLEPSIWVTRDDKSYH